MSDNSFDALSKMAAKSVSRRETLRGLSAALVGGLLATVGVKGAFAATAPQLCTICTCGTGTVCNETPATQHNCCVPGGNQSCTSQCGKHPVCGTSTVHCPQGCGHQQIPAACT
jgi:hypothetical protein